MEYRFVAPVADDRKKGHDEVTAISGYVATWQEMRYCTTADGVRLAYAASGSGPPLVKASNWLTHLDFEWDSPIWRHWWTRALSQHHRVIRYDERRQRLVTA